VASLTVAEALALVLREAATLPAESARLMEAHGRVLAKDLVALRTQPPTDVSAMDGYAVRAFDITNVPTSLAVIGEVAAGRPFDGTVSAGEAARIFTGGVMPAGADTVVIQEHTRRTDGRVLVEKPTEAGRNVRPKGLDFAEGAVLLRRGQRLTARDLALAAAMNHATVPVHQRPKVAVLATGDELVPPGATPSASEIVYSNGFATMALAEREGCAVIDLGIAPDRLPETVAAIRRARASGADILVTSGGASVGDYDLVQQALGGEGLALSFWKIAMRPGRPLLHGRLGAMHVLGLPGNPVSAYVGAFLFLVPLIRRLTGRTDIERAPEPAVLGADLPENDERTDYLRATLCPGPDGRQIATPHPLQDSSMLVPLAAADCLLIREPHAPAAGLGSPCVVLRLGL
jgi:molybdopterin molybdotransferase